MKKKQDKRDKKNKFKERVFEKNESDYYLEQEKVLKEQEEKEKRQIHKKIYGVETFESSNEDIKPKKDLNFIQEADEDEEDNSDLEPELKEQEKISNEKELKKDKQIEENQGYMKQKKENLIKEEKVEEVLDEDMKRLIKIRKERERAKKEKLLEKERLKLEAEKQRKEFEEKMKRKEEFKKKKRKGKKKRR